MKLCHNICQKCVTGGVRTNVRRLEMRFMKELSQIDEVFSKNCDIKNMRGDTI